MFPLYPRTSTTLQSAQNYSIVKKTLIKLIELEHLSFSSNEIEVALQDSIKYISETTNIKYLYS